MRFATYSLALVVGAAFQCTPIGPTLSPAGSWSGMHASLTLTDSGGAIEYDCAHGGLGAPVHTDQGGNFEVAGVHVPEHGGPVRDGEIPDSLPARYLGRISGNRMTLRVIVGTVTLGPFELERGGESRLLKCL